MGKLDEEVSDFLGGRGGGVIGVERRLLEVFPVGLLSDEGVALNVCFEPLFWEEFGNFPPSQDEVVLLS